MDFLDVAKLLARWWYVTMPLVLLTITAAFIVSQGIQPEFTAQGSVLVVAPSADETGQGAGGSNPLLTQNAALPTTAYVTSLALTSPQVGFLLGEEGLSTSYDVAVEDRLPIILLETRAPTRELATNTALRIVELIEDDLRLRQDAADVPSAERVSSVVIGVSSSGGADYGGRERLRIVVTALGLMLTLGAAFLLEGVAQRRRLRANGAASDDDGGRADEGNELEAERSLPRESSVRGNPNSAGRRHTDEPERVAQASSQ